MQSANSLDYEFGDFRIDVDKRLLLNGAGENLTLTPKVFDTLLYLVERRGEVVGKDELLAAVWPDTIVEENNLSQNISVLRRVMGEKRNEHRFIVTIPGRGYKFVAEVREVSVPNAGDYSQNRYDGSSASGQWDVERRGNVLALADWKENRVEVGQSDLAEGLLNSAGKKSVSRSVNKTALALIISALLLSVVFAVYWFGTRSNELGNVSVQNVTRLTNGFFPYDATISHDGKYFVYHEIDGDLYRMWLQQTGQTTRVEIVPASATVLSAKTFSPDGRFVYYIGTTPGENRSLYRVTSLGGTPTRLLSGIDSYVSFSPDGREMIFARYNDQSRELQYVILPSDGSGEERILFRRSVEQHVGGSPAWSPDGKTIVFGSLVLNENNLLGYELVSMPADGRAEPAAFSGGWGVVYRIAWRHDGSGVFLIGDRQGDAQSTRRDQVYYVSYPEGEYTRITTEDSRHQAFSLGVAADGAVLAVPFNRSSQLWSMDANGDIGTAVQITSGNADGRAGIAPLADGRIAFLARSGENMNIWSVLPDGTDLKQVNFDPPFVEELRSSNGAKRVLVFSAPTGSFNHLFRINSDGTDLRQLTFGDSFEVDSSISGDGAWIVYPSTVMVGTELNTVLAKIPIDGGDPVTFSTDSCSSPLLSPDDRLISCIRDKEILILSAEDGTLVRSVFAPPRAVLNFGAVWRPDGKAFVYIVDEKGEASNLWQRPIDGSAPTRLTNFSSGSIYRFAYSNDGKTLFLARGQQIRDAILIKPAF